MNEDTKKFAQSLADYLMPLVEVTLISKEKETVWNRLPKGQGKELTLAVPGCPDEKLRLRLDVAMIRGVVTQFSRLIEEAEKPPESNWQQQVDAEILQFLDTKGLTKAGLRRTEKRELVLHLRDRGFMHYKEATSYLADVLRISRATVYNYLKVGEALQSIRVHQVDTFTDERFEGNPAGVVLDAEELSEALMRSVAREMKVSETSFVLPSDKADLRLRFFTPTGDEVNFCGHSTVGAMYMLGHEHRFGIEGTGAHAFSVETGAGVVLVEVLIDDKQAVSVTYESPSIDLTPSELSHEDFARAMGISVECLDTRYPVMYEATTCDLIAAVQDLDRLKKIDPDNRKLEKFSRKNGNVRFCLFAKGGFSEESTLHCRCFSPAIGIPEDPFTGAVQGGLAAFAHMHGIIPEDLKVFRVEQGHFIDRPGIVEITLSKEGDRYHAKVLARAVHCFSNEIPMV